MSDTTNGPGADPNGTPDEGSEFTELASAYLDGDTTPEERAQVESSDEILAEVESLRQVRAVLGATTEPPPISIREAHLAAALGVWDRMSDMEQSGEVTPSAGMDAAAGAAITTPRPTSMGSRGERRSSGSTSRWLLGAAAGLIVIAGGGIVIRNLDTASNDEGDLATDAVAAVEDDATEAEEVAREASDEFNNVDVESAPLDVPADVAFDEDIRSEDEALSSQSADAAEAPAEEAVEESMADEDAMEEEPSAGGEADPFPPEIDLDPLDTVEQLADFAAIAAYSTVGLDTPATTTAAIEQPYPTCDEEFGSFFTIDQYVGPAAYQGELVVVGIDADPEPDNVIAYRPTDCVIVEQTPLPTLEEFEAGRNQP